jgi:hypothetical protein
MRMSMPTVFMLHSATNLAMLSTPHSEINAQVQSCPNWTHTRQARASFRCTTSTISKLLLFHSLRQFRLGINYEKINLIYPRDHGFLHKILSHVKSSDILEYHRGTVKKNRRWTRKYWAEFEPTLPVIRWLTTLVQQTPRRYSHHSFGPLDSSLRTKRSYASFTVSVFI